MGEASWTWKSEEEILFEKLVDQEANRRRANLDTHMAAGCLRRDIEEELKKDIFLNHGRTFGKSLLSGDRYPNGREK